MKNEILIWSDGSSRGNPGQGGWGVIIVSPEKEVIELGDGEGHTTNNRMELSGAISSLSYITKNYLSSSSVMVHTDSRYVINGITKWIHGWRKNNWLTSQKEEVLNRDLWEKLFSLTVGKKIEWKYVAGHSGTPGNERCDEIATSFADGNNPSLYKGALANYSVPIFDLSKVSSAGKKTKSRSKAKAYSYLSMIGGEIMKHKSWEECEKRVKGKSGARFKKALSAEEEEEILKGWTGK
jgi:ribonuclease HI